MSENTKTFIEYSADLSEQELPPPLPIGTYPAQIVSVGIPTSKSSGNDYFDIAFRIEPEAYPADFVDGDPDGIVINYRRLSAVDKPQSRYRVRRFIEAIGARLGRSIDVTDWIGLGANVVIGHSTFEGETRAEITKVIS